MGSIRLIKPLALPVPTGAFTGAARVATPDPKEAAIYIAGGSGMIAFDFGSDRMIDTVFVGYTSGGSPNLEIRTGGGSGTTTSTIVQPAPSDIFVSQHYLLTLPNPVPCRYLEIRPQTTFPAMFTVGVVAVGFAFVPTFGQAPGAGRPIEDTGSAERLFGGGFGIDEGAIVGGYSWTFGELQEAEVRALYALVRSVGLTKPVLLIEDEDFTPGLNERIHWGLLRRIDTYERLSLADWRWSLVIGDWG